MPGHGATATVAGRRVAVGNRKLMVDEDVDVPTPLMARRDELASTGRTAVLIAVDGRGVGVIALADAARETSAEGRRRVARSWCAGRDASAATTRPPRRGSPGSSASTPSLPRCSPRQGRQDRRPAIPAPQDRDGRGRRERRPSAGPGRSGVAIGAAPMLRSRPPMSC